MRGRNATLREAATLVSASVVVALLVCELGLRIVGLKYTTFYEADEDRGYGHRVGAAGRWNREGSSFVRISRHGFRDRDRPMSKPPGTFRVAVLGDSFVEGVAVPLDQTFVSVLGRQLQRCSHSAAEVDALNFGVGGYGTAQALLTLSTNVWAFDPDVVMLAFVAGNDMRDNYRTLRGDGAVPYFVWTGNELVFDSSFLRDGVFRFKRSWVGSTYYALPDYLWLFGLFHEARQRLSVLLAPERDIREYHAQYRSVQDTIWQEAWAVTTALIREMRDEVHDKERAFWLATLTHGPQVHPDSTFRREYAERLGVERLDYPDRRLERLAAQLSIPMVTLLDPLRAHAESTGAYLHGFENAILGDGHYNELGHRLVGEILAHRLCEAGVLQGRSVPAVDVAPE